VSDWFYEKLRKYHIEDEKRVDINKKIGFFESFIKEKLPKCNYMVERFKSKQAKWMPSKISISLKESCKIPLQPGRPTLSYTNAGPRLKRKLASELAIEKDNNTNLLMHAAAVSGKRQCNTNVALVLKEMITAPEYTTELRMQL